MVHGKNAGECEQTIDAIANETDIREYELLWSIKEYKKVRIRYFTPEWDAYINKFSDELANVTPLDQD